MYRLKVFIMIKKENIIWIHLVITIGMILLFTSSCESEDKKHIPGISWQKTFGGSDSDFASSIIQTTDGGYIVAGNTFSNDENITVNHGEDDYWVVKLTSNGDIEWQKSLGGSSSDQACSIKQTTDEGYIIAGYSISNDGDVTENHDSYDYWIVKLTSTGDIEWQKSLGGSSYDMAFSIDQTTDGGYIIAGLSNSNDGDVSGNHGKEDYWIVKLTSSGDLGWQKSLGGSGQDWARSIQQTTDGGYIIAGYSELSDGDITGNHGQLDYWIVKLTSIGEIDWQKSLGGSSSDWAKFIQQTTDGGYIVAGHTRSFEGDVTENKGLGDCWIVKLTSAGDIVWQKSLGGSSWDVAFSIDQTADEGYIIAGYSSSHDGDVTEYYGGYDYWIIKLASTGELDWQKSLGRSGLDWACSIQQTTDGGYIIAGYTQTSYDDKTGDYTNSDYWIVKLY